MKTVITLLTATALFAGVTGAMADQQSSDESAGYALSQQLSRGFGGAYASARVPAPVRDRGIVSTGNIGTADVPNAAIDFQAQGSH